MVMSEGGICLSKDIDLCSMTKHWVLLEYIYIYYTTIYICINTYIKRAACHGSTSSCFATTIARTIYMQDLGPICTPSTLDQTVSNSNVARTKQTKKQL